jgi:hypothetical protein
MACSCPKGLAVKYSRVAHDSSDHRLGEREVFFARYEVLSAATVPTEIFSVESI